MEQIKFNIFSGYEDIIEHGITCRGNDFFHVDVIFFAKIMQYLYFSKRQQTNSYKKTIHKYIM